MPVGRLCEIDQGFDAQATVQVQVQIGLGNRADEVVRIRGHGKGSVGVGK